MQMDTHRSTVARATASARRTAASGMDHIYWACERGDHRELRKLMKPGGFMRRDNRMVERKKYNQRKARKKFQWNKR